MNTRHCPFCEERVLGYQEVEGYVVFEPCGHVEPVQRAPGLAVWLDLVRETARA